jgi:hypothetical protein
VAKYFDISDWNEKTWFSTKGSRNKIVVEDPQNNKLYYYKTSLKKPGKDYKHEYWSEIIASEIGSYFGFNVLKYDIAWHKDEMGCISESMNTEGESELTEGIQYLTGYNTSYNPKSKEAKREYTFQFICDALDYFELDKYIHDIVRIIIFDSLVGNSDRHQENWGIITNNKKAAEEFHNKAEIKNEGFLKSVLFSLLAAVFDHFPKLRMKEKILLHSFMPNFFAPIYDSGCCLGRELLDVKVHEMLLNEEQIITYIQKGTSEIHWEGCKLSHFELIQQLVVLYPELVRSEIGKVTSTYDESIVENIIFKIDDALPPEKVIYGLPLERKKLIHKMVSLRFKEISKMLS